jgi:uncharacterized protein (TIGR00297 family)
MTPSESATVALAVTAVLAVVARIAGTLTTGGAVAGAVVGACVSLGFGLPGLAVLGTFFVAGSLATRIGWARKKAGGTAEAGEGRRDARRVVGKGGVAAAVALVYIALCVSGEFVPGLWHFWFVVCATVAAALADTLGTEIGVLSKSEPRTLPLFERVPTGTPGAVSFAGIAGAVAGSALVAAVAFAVSRDWGVAPAHPELTIDPVAPPWHSAPLGYPLTWFGFAALTVIGAAASLVESLAVGFGFRASGFVRNLLTTGAGATFGCMLWPLRGSLFE